MRWCASCADRHSSAVKPPDPSTATDWDVRAHVHELQKLVWRLQRRLDKQCEQTAAAEADAASLRQPGAAKGGGLRELATNTPSGVVRVGRPKRKAPDEAAEAAEAVAVIAAAAADQPAAPGPVQPEEPRKRARPTASAPPLVVADVRVLPAAAAQASVLPSAGEMAPLSVLPSFTKLISRTAPAPLEPAVAAAAVSADTHRPAAAGVELPRRTSADVDTLSHAMQVLICSCISSRRPPAVVRTNS